MNMNAEKLKLLSRKQIQAVAIEHGIKGNMRSEDMIQVLVKRYPNGVPLRLPDPRPASSQNGAVTSRTVIMQWSEAQGRYIEIPVETSNLNQRPPPIAGPSQPQSQYQSLGVFTLPATNYTTAQRPTASRISTASNCTTSAPQACQTASSNSYMHYKNAPEFLPGPQMFSASTRLPGPADQMEARRVSNSCSRPHAQQAPYPVVAPSTVWRAPASAMGSTTRPSSPARSAEPALLDDSVQGPGSGWLEPPIIHAPLEVDTPPGVAQPTLPTMHPREACDPVQKDVQPAQPSLATDSNLYDTVRKMASIAKFQQHCRNTLEGMNTATSITGETFSDLDALVQQECVHFQRMSTFVDHVHPELAPRWRPNVIWDKACPTYLDDEDNLLEYDTDDENAPKSPAPVMVRRHLKPPPRKASPEHDEAAGNDIGPGPAYGPAVTESASAPASSKRKHVDEDDQLESPLAKKRTRRSRATMPRPGTPAPSRLTRSAVRRKIAEERALDGINEDEEEQDMISVLSILTQPIDDDSE
ncbi:hypothetical protein L226DRAFT_562054 [Lentinus tigrinus ALCF2SS1-7]|uniref:Uncharacterized protein n=1 Tax=Lentinus tigrinus ALCF2SS1-6 TaxID=1328759 RepID=A0A5C2S2U5_9APHY|nr:hypothetical protein L227DRAFT_655349 [Lentinus tigrinus ALCF2SS1-6]RPD71830.1 hypothetical protein L226DRAFT_562054 [Lentinus tigrinus ALCF2SS1-7]